MYSKTFDDLKIWWATHGSSQATPDPVGTTRHFANTNKYAFYIQKSMRDNESGVDVCVVQSPTFLFQAFGIITVEPNSERSKALGLWKVGWYQCVTKYSFAARYSNNKNLEVRCNQLPAIDSQEGEEDYPFTDAGTLHGDGTFTIESSDEPCFCFPIRHPADKKSKIERTEGIAEFFTLFGAYNKSNKKFIILEGYEWSVDYAGKCDLTGNAETATWNPTGNGISFRKLTDKSEKINASPDGSRTAIWGAHEIASGGADIDDCIKDCYDGNIWLPHVDRTTNEGADGEIKWR